MIPEIVADVGICKQCGKLKSPEKRKNQFCSQSCASTWNNILRGKFIGKKDCKQCGKIFSVQAKKTFENRKFCSPSCASKYNNSHGGGSHGKKRSDEFKAMMSLATKGDKNASKRIEVRKKISEKLKGRIPYWIKGKKRPDHSKFMKIFISNHRPKGFGDRIGDEHPFWKGGVSYEPYCQAWTDKEYKHSILERDAYQCRNSSCKRITNKLSLHHINYNKKDCHPLNLITLCFSCNSKANYHRPYWRRYYSNLLKGGDVYGISAK